MAKEYSLRAVACIVNGIPITGFSEGDAITIASDDDLFSKQTGADGEVARSAKGNRGGTITFRVMYVADSNKILEAIKKLDRLSSGGVVSILIRDSNGGTSVFAGEAWIKKDPDITFGEESGEREWIFDCAELEKVHKGNNNLAGGIGAIL